MNLVGLVVKHKIFGIGKVIAMGGDQITVAFSDADKRFIYPDAFESFLSISDEKLLAQLQEAIKKSKALPIKPQAKRASLGAVSASADSRVSKRGTVKKPLQIAFKCNYCDGGATKDSFGYNGVCSDAIIENNITVQKRVWCSEQDCACSRYLQGEISRSELDSYMEDEGSVCYESHMLRDWTAYAGVTHNGDKKGTPRRQRGVGANSLAILTTRLPETPESDRVIFAVFLVDESYEGDDTQPGLVSTGSKHRLALSPGEAKKMRFWNYYANRSSPKEPRWGTGLYRHFDELTGARIVRDIVTLSAGTSQEDLAMDFLEYYCRFYGIDVQNIPEANGALVYKN